MSSNTSHNPMLTAKQCAEYMGISYSTFRTLKCQGAPLPKRTVFGQRDYYRLSDINDFLDNLRAPEFEAVGQTSD